ncbi:MAG TPA: histidine phosphatase family protein [Candidatus Limnocylindria bacterium]|nr:histidine phosphatase family protein [Candidatus Limnocylindria bacterium]
MQLICVRHGRTAWNADRRFQGHTDIPLDDEGRAQATALGSLLREERIDAAVSSDLSRARETAQLVLGARAVIPRLDPDWREMRFGDWEGLTWDEIVAANPQLDRGAGTSPKRYTPAGGESFDDLCERVARALTRVTAELQDETTALIATHAGPLHAVLRVLLGDDEYTALQVRFAPASLTRLRREDGAWRVEELNRTAEVAP